MTAILAAQELEAGYGEIKVLHGLTLECREGCVTAMVGSNGAGKTTLMRTLAGIVPVTRGEIRFQGATVQRQAAHERVASGLILVPEGRLVFPDMSVEDNLRTGAINRRARGTWRATLDEIYLLFPRLRERRQQKAGSLSGGEQQMLALGRGLMGLPRLLLLDEPTLGLAPMIARQIFEVIPQLVERGISVLIAEQDLYRTLDIADYAYVLENGRITEQDSGSALKANPRIVSAYLGT